MFEIFGALFGGAWLLHKFTSEKSASKAFDRRFQTIEAIRKSVSDWEYEREMRSKFFYILPPDIQNGTIKLTPELHEKIWNDVLEMRDNVVHNIIPAKDMEFVFGENWEEWFEQLPEEYDWLRNQYESAFGGKFGGIWEVVFNIWLSMQGYIGYWHTYRGYNYKHDIVGVLHDDRIRVATRACQVIERNIRKRYNNDEGFKLYVHDGADYKLIWKYEFPDSIGNRLW